MIEGKPGWENAGSMEHQSVQISKFQRVK